MRFATNLLIRVLSLLPAVCIKPFAAPYIAGETLEDLLATVRRLNGEGYLATVDLLGEFIHQESEARLAAQTYQDVLHALSAQGLQANVSVKLSQMGLLLNPTLCEELLNALAMTAKKLGNFVRIDMEDSACTEATIALYLRLRERHDNVGIVLQAMLRRTLADAERIMAVGAGHFRLCKGIYVEPEAVAYQGQGVIHKNYVHVLRAMLTGGAYVGIATHHEDLLWEACRIINELKLRPDQYEFQMLLGVTPQLRRILKENGHRVRVYVPYGAQWHAYSMRRLHENPAILGHLLRNKLNVNIDFF
jgi:proline dehydrogenase